MKNIFSNFDYSEDNLKFTDIEESDKKVNYRSEKVLKMASDRIKKYFKE